MKYDAKEIRREYRVSDVAKSYGVKLQKDGKEFRACCPFHSEKTASFTIYTGRDHVERFQCFGCGVSGDVIEFVTEYHGLDPKKGFVEACKILTGDTSAPKTKPKIEDPDIFDPYEEYAVMPVPEGTAPILAGKATPPLLNPKRLDAEGYPRTVTYRNVQMVHPYRDATGRLMGYVLRIDLGEGRKITPAILWARNKTLQTQGWIHGSMPEPRAVYRAEVLAANPSKQVLVVEGEKCADAGAEITRRCVTISWLGGAKAFEKTDWTVLQGRRVVFWEDNDPEGENTIRGWWDQRGKWHRGIAEIALEIGADQVKVIPRVGEGMPKGWDIYDAIHDDGMGETEVLRWAADRAIIWTHGDIEIRKTRTDPTGRYRPPADYQERPKSKPEPVEQAKPTEQVKPDPGQREAGKPSVPTVRPRDGNVVSLFGNPIPKFELEDDWRKHLIYNEDNKLVAKRHTNFLWMLRGNDRIAGTFAYNEVAQDIYVVKRPPWLPKTEDKWQYRPATDDDVIHLISFLEKCGLTPKATDIDQVLPIVAKDRAFNPVQHYLNTLKWDGVDRLMGAEDTDPFVCKYLGHPTAGRNTRLYATFFTRWMVSAVARALSPGVKADCMIVLEGVQGFRKSSLLEALATIEGVPYFTDDVHDIESKEASIAMQGKWIIEIPELNAFGRKETEAIKAWLSRKIDRFRIPYAKKAADFPRHSIFAGTMNPSGVGYLKDSTGARRFWPIPVLVPIDTTGIAAERDQLWAEAVTLYRQGMQWHLTDVEAEQAKAITSERYEQDAWAGAINEIISGSTEVSIDSIMAGLNIPRAQQNSLTVKRIAEHLRVVGYEKRRRKNDLFKGRGVVWVRGGEIDVDGDREHA